MLLEDIEKEWAIDSVISNLKLDNESLKIPKFLSYFVCENNANYERDMRNKLNYDWH